MVLTCPSCRGSLTAEPAPAPHVVGCPHCRQPLTVPAAVVEVADEPPAEESVFQTAPATRRRGRYRGAKPSSSGRWVVLGVVGVLLVAAGVGAFLFFGTDKERHQLDSLYSEYTDDLDELSRRMEASNAGPLTDERVASVKAYGDIATRTNAARSKLWTDYLARYKADPKYLKPKDRAQPNPMRARYPTDK